MFTLPELPHWGKDSLSRSCFDFRAVIHAGVVTIVPSFCPIKNIGLTQDRQTRKAVQGTDCPVPLAVWCVRQGVFLVFVFLVFVFLFLTATEDYRQEDKSRRTKLPGNLGEMRRYSYSHRSPVFGR